MATLTILQRLCVSCHNVVHSQVHRIFLIKRHDVIFSFTNVFVRHFRIAIDLLVCW